LSAQPYIPETDLKNGVIFDVMNVMKITRRNILKITGFSILAASVLPRSAKLASNGLVKSIAQVQNGDGLQNVWSGRDNF
jgi:hypothetical protein